MTFKRCPWFTGNLECNSQSWLHWVEYNLTDIQSSSVVPWLLCEFCPQNQPLKSKKSSSLSVGTRNGITQTKFKNKFHSKSQ